MWRCLPVLIGLVALSGCGPRREGPSPAAQGEQPSRPAEALVKYNKLAVRLQPREVKDPKNYLTTVNRGEKVVVLEQDSAWTKVRLSDDKEGYIPSRYLVPADVNYAVMLIGELLVYQRPDPSSPRLAADTAMARQGLLLWVTKQKDGFAECQFPNGKSGWIASGELTTDSTEVAAARLLEQARAMVAENKMDEAAAFYLKIAERYGQSRVAAVAADESGISARTE
ncbi:MAG: SH3 domain-containing protein [Candidatus Edwardsbacteria bacterium]|jgi:SH3-like domain-containing protein|nr:SH3 domain-containing protein [Candidatus Edwardsbacteria bacterium]